MRTLSTHCLLSILILSFVSNVFAFAPNDAALKNIVPFSQESSRAFTVSSELRKEVKSRFPGATVAFNKHTGRVRSLQGKLMAPSRRNAVELAEEFIAQNSDILGEGEFKLEKNLKHGKTNHISFTQVVDGIAVHGCEVKVHVNGDGSVSFVTCDAAEHVAAVHSAENVTADEAQEIALKNIGSKSDNLRTETVTTKTYLPTADGAKLSWSVRIAATEPLGDYEIFVDASSGEVLSRTNQMSFLETGKGDVYETHPMAGDIVEKTLDNMSALTALKGPYARVVNDDVDEASEESGVYKYPGDDTHFDEVMVYHHLNIIHDYFKDELGFDGLDRQMKATVHYGTNYDNAFYSPWQGGFAFGDGNRLNDLAREASVIYHEYTHAVTGNICSMAYANESGAINEGISDYFGCILTNDAKLGEWAVAKMGKPYMRWLEDTVHYPEDIHGEVHYDGKIWGCVCWDLKKALGEAVASPLVHKCRYYLSYRATFVEGLKGIIEADKQLNNGENYDQIIEVFAGRGIVLEAEDQDNSEELRFKELFAE